MTNTATLKVYSGTGWITVSGRIVRVTETGGIIIDDERGVRHFALKERATINNDADPSRTRNNMLW